MTNSEPSFSISRYQAGIRMLAEMLLSLLAADEPQVESGQGERAGVGDSPLMIIVANNPVISEIS